MHGPIDRRRLSALRILGPILLLAGAALGGTLRAETIADWNLTGQPGNQATQPPASAAVGVTGGNIQRGSGLATSNANSSFSSSGWEQTGSQPGSDNEYISFGFTANAGKSVDLEFLNIGTGSSGTGPGTLGLYYNGDGYTSPIVTFNQQPGNNFLNAIVDLSALPDLTGAVEFRLIEIGNIQADGDGATASGGTFRVTAYFAGGSFDRNMQLTGTVKDLGGLDTTPPAVLSRNPTANATDVATDIGAVAIVYDEPIQAMDLTNVTVECPLGSSVALSKTVAGSTLTVQVGSLPFATQCTVTVPAGAVADLAGNPAPLETYSFDTEAALAGCGDPATLISAVQGSGTTSPLNGQVVTVEAVVVGNYQGPSATSLQGYFIQEDDAQQDSDPLTSEGIFVYDPGTLAAVDVGDRVRVTGTVSEYFKQTQVAASSVLVCATGQSVTPAQPILPVPIVPTGDLPADTAAINAYYERFEGMLVTFPDTLSVSEYFELERYGQLELVQGGRISTFTAVNEPSAAGYTDHRIDLARRTLVLDDGNNTQNAALFNSTALPYPFDPVSGILGLSSSHRFRGGDTIDNLTGVMSWTWGGFTGTDAWRIRPVTEIYPYTFVPANPRPVTSPDVGGSLKVASFNVLNYFSTIDITPPSSNSGDCGPSGTLDCRGADSADELARQTEKATSALCGMNADIVGLMEIENNATASLDVLVDALNVDPSCGPYVYVNTGTIGTDAIKVGLLYKPATVLPVGSHAILDSTVDSDFIDTGNRPALAQTFQKNGNGARLTVAVNHLKSKSCTDATGPDTDQNDGQGCWNDTRTKAAQALADWLATDPTGSGDPDVLIVGDLNSYAKEDPIAALEADGYTNLVLRDGGLDAYSYVFDGQIGYLDHALANPSLEPQVTGVAEWHINADEPPAFDYNDTVKDLGESSFEARPSTLPLYLPDERRTSDHDPVLIGLDLDPPPPVPGDLSGDDRVTWAADRPLMLAAMGSQTGQAKYRADADFDGAGKVTLVDYRAWYSLWVAGGRTP